MRVRIWDVDTGKLVRTIEQNVGRSVWSLDFSPNSNLLAISGVQGFASLWDVPTGAKVGPRIRVGSREAMLDLSPDGRRLMMTNSDGKGPSGSSTRKRGRSAPARLRTAR